MIHVMLSEEEIQHLIEALHCTLQMLKEKDPENGHHFAPMYQRVKDKLELIQNAIKHQTEKEDEHETSRMQ